jgi:hypothetical protein
VNTYVLSFNPHSGKVSTTQIAGYVSASRDISQWYSPFVGTVYIKSAEPLMELSSKISTQFEGDLFSLTFVVPHLISGSMAPEVWSWLNASPSNITIGAT